MSPKKNRLIRTEFLMNYDYSTIPQCLFHYLAFLSELGVNIEDDGLQQLCITLYQLEDYDVLRNAAGALFEAHSETRVQTPNGYIKTALRQRWKPRYAKTPLYNGSFE
jgi:hypothetical protein